MFRKLKKEPTLYKAYLEEKEKLLAAKAEEELLSKQSSKNERGKLKKISCQRTTNICVFSLCHGCGVTYLSEILATFLAKCNGGRTCLIETNGLTEVLAHSLIDVFTYPCDMSSIYKKRYDFLVTDLGVFDTFSENDYKIFEEADFKCIVSWPDEQSLSRLASFVENTECSEAFVYFFNMVPSDQISNILNLMEDYNTVILPCTSLKNMDKRLVSKLYSVFSDEKILL